MGDVKQSLGLAVDVAETCAEGAFDEVDAVVWLLRLSAWWARARII